MARISPKADAAGQLKAGDTLFQPLRWYCACSVLQPAQTVAPQDLDATTLQKQGLSMIAAADSKMAWLHFINEGPHAGCCTRGIKRRKNEARKVDIKGKTCAAMA